MKRIGITVCLIAFTCACRKDNYPKTGDVYDVILVAGQSNTHYGYGIDSVLDSPSDKVFQLGRFDTNNYKVIPAAEPLDHITKKSNSIGFALTFAKLYADAFLDDDRKVLIIPAGRSGSGFENNKWHIGDTLYNDAVKRTLFVLQNFYGSRLVAVLWQQGENDVENPAYQAELDQFIKDIRADLHSVNLPFILGGMVPYWVSLKQQRITTQQIISETPLRLENTAYADPTWPTVITHDTTSNGPIHYTAEGLREMGLRYFAAYSQVRD